MSGVQRKELVEEDVTNDILTLPNIISFARLCLIPLFFCLLLGGYNILATLIFALAASTDWVDGQIARRTHCVSKLGQLLDPAVDRLLMISGVLGLFLVGRLAAWIIALVILRDLFLLFGGALLLRKFQVRVPVIYLGKVATTLLYIGFAALLLNWPQIDGLGLCQAPWLAGFNDEACSWGIWLVYLGLVLSVFATVHYIRCALSAIQSTQE